MIRRRTFLKGCGGIAAAPALECLAASVAVAQGPPEVAREVTYETATSLHAPAAYTALRIDGWTTDADPGDAWVHIGPSWRANWR